MEPRDTKLPNSSRAATLDATLALIVAGVAACSSGTPRPRDTVAASTSAARPAAAGSARAAPVAPGALVDSAAGAVDVEPDTGGRRGKSRRKRAAGKDSATASAAPDTLWPVKNVPAPLPGSILPAKRIVAFYGNPLSKRMGVLGEYPPEVMLAKLDTEVARWQQADPGTPVQPALHMIVSVAQPEPGKDSVYRQRSDTGLIRKVYGWAQRKHALLFLDVQLGRSTLQAELPRLVPFLSQPDVHLAIDPEFAMTKGGLPGKKIGTLDATHVNYAAQFLADLVTQYHLPPKVLVVHRFTRDMLTGYRNIKLDPRVQIVINMDGWGPPSLKRDTYRRYVHRYPVEYTGFKLFFHNDTKKGDRLMTPADVLALNPKPVYIQYQ